METSKNAGKIIIIALAALFLILFIWFIIGSLTAKPVENAAPVVSDFTEEPVTTTTTAPISADSVSDTNTSDTTVAAAE